jgi:hypothetical protein
MNTTRSSATAISKSGIETGRKRLISSFTALVSNRHHPYYTTTAVGPSYLKNSSTDDTLFDRKVEIASN